MDKRRKPKKQPCAAERIPLTGVLCVRKSGWGLVPIEASGNGPATVSIEPKYLGSALHGDRIQVSLCRPPSNARGDANEYYGVIDSILERKHTELVGTLDAIGVFVPDDFHINLNFKVKTPKAVKIGDTIVVSLQYIGKTIKATFKENLGSSKLPQTEMQALLRRYGLEDSFPEAVLQAVKNFPKRVEPQSLQGRLDLRQLHTLTIDPEDAKDFDDALSLEPLSFGKARIGVHIADVSSYIPAQSALDLEARKRGNSTYLGPTVIPMLPFELSNELCSLKPGEDRLTKSVLMTFSRSAKLLKVEFANSVICSKNRLSYADAYALLKHDPTSSAEKLEAQRLRSLWAYASKLRQQRMKNGSLDLDMPEVRIRFTPSGYPEAIVPVFHDESHQLIEEFMLAANDAVAKALHERKLPAIYRVHAAPDADRLDALRETLQDYGVKARNLQKPKALAELLLNLKEHPQGSILKQHVLRSLKQACYDTLPLGHYGLAKQDYLHFTSPIRRYADLAVHRSFEKLVDPQINIPATPLAAIAKHISHTEQNSTEAERDFQKRKRFAYFCEQLQKNPKACYKAVVLEVKAQGLFIELPDSLTFGFLPVQNLPPDYYQLSDNKKILIGQKQGQHFAIGATLLVKIQSVDTSRQEIDFSLKL